jgi:hypothetical protein
MVAQECPEVVRLAGMARQVLAISCIPNASAALWRAESPLFAS